MNTFLDLAKERFSVRKFDARPIEQEKLDKIIEAGHVAPTGANLQPQRIYILQSKESLDKVQRLTRSSFGASTVLLFAYDSMEEIIPPDKRVTLGVQDISIVATHMMLEAWDLGIGSCWVNAFSNRDLEVAFQLPSNEKVVLIMPIGYPDKDAKPSEKSHSTFKPIEDVVTYL